MFCEIPPAAHCVVIAPEGQRQNLAGLAQTFEALNREVSSLAVTSDFNREALPRAAAIGIV